jgi:hypothetical protein
MDNGTEHEARAYEPHGGRRAPVTAIQKAIVVGAIVVLAGGAGSLVTARLTDRQPDLEEQLAANTQLTSQVRQNDARIAELASQVSQKDARIAELAGQAAKGTEGVDRLNAEIAALKEQVRALGAEKTGLQEQLQQILNPAPGPTPTGVIRANWLTRYGGGTPTAICIEIENTSRGDASFSYSYSQISVTAGENFVYPPRLHTPGYSIQLSTPLLFGELRPGEKRRGELLYDIPVGVIPKTLVWKAEFGKAAGIAVKLPHVSGTYQQGTC